jgi:hypothetical protein
VTAGATPEATLPPSEGGDTYRNEPVHHAEVVGNQPFVAMETESKTAETYANG